MSGGVSYYGHNARGPDSDLELDGVPYDEPGYLTDLISKRAAQYVRERAASGEKFFLSLHYTAPHWPWGNTRSGAYRSGHREEYFPFGWRQRGNLPHHDPRDGRGHWLGCGGALRNGATGPWSVARRAYRDGDWKYLKVNEHEYLFNLSRDARERANQSHREPQKIESMRAKWQEWNAQIPPVPLDAVTHQAYTLSDMPAR